jgi:G3E family GTPase
MAREIYIISGFLGAGKTTLIQKLLKEAFGDKKVALIENDFGEISIDSLLLKTDLIEVKEINSGCICCNLSGDFAKALAELLTRYEPDVVIIEPSGVGKLSDVIKACMNPDILSMAEVKTCITVVDVKRCKMFLENFGEFFEDQIKNADVILFSRVEDYPDKIETAANLIQDLKKDAFVLANSWDELVAGEIIHPTTSLYGSSPNGRCEHHHHDCHDHHEPAHEHFHHGDDCGCNHWAEEVFDTVTIHTSHIFSVEELGACMKDLEQNTKGTILRAKGIVRTAEGYINLQYLPGDINITQCAAAGETLCIIGNGLDKRELNMTFNGE